MLGYWEKEPVDVLRAYVAALWVWEGMAPPKSYRVLPDGCIDIVFGTHVDYGVSCHTLVVVGTMTRHFEVSRTDVGLLLGARFRPAGAVPFLGCPASEMTNLRFSLEELWGRDARRLLGQLTRCVSVSDRLDVLERTLLARLAGDRLGDARIMYAARRIAADSSFSKLDELAFDVGLSARQFRRRFETEVGIGPKLFSRVIRFQRLLKTVLERGGNWSDLALELGYFDQAHLIRDFKEFTGLSPTRYLASR